MSDQDQGFDPSPHLLAKFEFIIQRLIATNKIDDIMSTTQRKSGSFASQVLDLAPGECASKARICDPTIEVSRLKDELPELRQQLRNSVAPAVRNAAEKTGASYGVEVGETITPSGNLYLVAIVTRKAE
jgi:hypothetical protein